MRVILGKEREERILSVNNIVYQISGWFIKQVNGWLEKWMRDWTKDMNEELNGWINGRMSE
jgi:hypothetical protein